MISDHFDDFDDIFVLLFWANNLHSGSALAGENLQDCQSRHSDLLGMEYSISCPAALMFIFFGFSVIFLFPIFPIIAAVTLTKCFLVYE